MNLLENAISILKEAKLQINKSEIRIHASMDRAIKMIEKSILRENSKDLNAYFLLYILHDVLKHLPSISDLIRTLHSS